MRVPTLMKQNRLANGFESLQQVKDIVGIDRGTLSMIERGRQLPADTQVPLLELAYGPPAGWYEPSVLLLIQRDGESDGE